MVALCAAGLQAQAAESHSDAHFAPGATLPVMMLDTIHAERARAGDIFYARLMQKVELDGGETLPQSTRVRGHVIAAQVHEPSHDAFGNRLASQLTVTFDAVEFHGHFLPVNLVVRAIASPAESWAALRPMGDADLDPTETRVQIGGDRVTPSQPEVMDAKDQIVGHHRNLSVYARLIAQDACDGTDREVPVGVFSASACGGYGFGNVHIEGFGSAASAGALTLASTDRSPVIARNSAALLEVMSPATVQHATARKRR